MTTPVSQYTAGRIITFAYRDCLLVQEGSVPNSEQLARGWMLLQDMVNFWITQGLKLWITADIGITLVQGQNTYTMGPAGTVVMAKPLQVVEGYYADSNGIRRPLIPLAWDDWVRLSQVNQQGQINSYFVDKQQTQFIVKTWLVPDAVAATGTLHLVTRQQMVNPVALTDSMGFPIEWGLALRWGLADELATGQPERIVQRCQAKAAMYRQALDDWDVEDAPTQFVPDARMGFYGMDFQ